MSFINDEKERYAKLKSVLFSPEAQPDGTYNKKSYPFCLADGYSQENLNESFRDEAIEYFKERKITWHDGIDLDGIKHCLPSCHLCCSQTMCVNTLFPMTTDPELFKNVFQVYFPEMKEAIPFHTDQSLSDGSYPYICFEFVGEKTHFEGEKKWPQRGANCTSLDFAFFFRRYDGKKQLVLGEWKYTEKYKSHKLPPKNEINQTRWDTYKDDFKIWKTDKPDIPTYENYFVEPFYQLMRQSVLADKMQREKEMDADIVVHLHISPKANREFSDTFTSPIFSKYGNTILEAWRSISPKDKFTSINSESLMTVIEQVAQDDKKSWADWLLKRYGWWR